MLILALTTFAMTFIIVYEMKKIFKFLQFGQIIQRGLNLNFHIPIKKTWIKNWY